MRLYVLSNLNPIWDTNKQTTNILEDIEILAQPLLLTHFYPEQ